MQKDVYQDRFVNEVVTEALQIENGYKNLLHKLSGIEANFNEYRFCYSLIPHTILVHMRLKMRDIDNLQTMRQPRTWKK